MRPSRGLVEVLNPISDRCYKFPTEADRMTYLIKSLEAEILRAEPDELVEELERLKQEYESKLREIRRRNR